MSPKLRDWEGERVPKIDGMWMLAYIKNSTQNGWFGRPKFKKIVRKTIPKTMHFSHAFFYRFHWTPPGGGHRRLPICVQESWGTAMPLRLACAGLQCWRHMGKWKPTFWLQFAQTWRSWQETCGTRVFPENVGLEARKSRPGGYKIISFRRLPNRGPESPKSSPEPYKTLFFKDT